MQEIGESVDAIIADDNKLIQDIVQANKHRTEKYWIMLFAKPSRNSLNGKPILSKHIKVYANKPPSLVGVICGEVDNSTGQIDWEINMPQAPFDYDALNKFGVIQSNDLIIESRTLPNSYLIR